MKNIDLSIKKDAMDEIIKIVFDDIKSTIIENKKEGLNKMYDVTDTSIKKNAFSFKFLDEKYTIQANTFYYPIP